MRECYYAESKSRNELREYAKVIRKSFHLENELNFPVVEVLDYLAVILDGLFNYEIIGDNELPPDQHACTDVVKCVIKIKESVYVGAVKGCGRDRMTIAHELAHFFLIIVFGVQLYQTKGNRQIKPYESPEWQAKCLAGELMMDRELVKNLSVFDIELKCGVSSQAAIYQYKIIHQ